MAKTKMILWDADGVLFHSCDQRGSFFWAENVEQDLGLSYDQVQGIFHDGWDAVLRGDKDSRLHIEEHFTKHGYTLPIDRYIDYWLEKDSRLNSEVVALLNPANSCIATNQESLRTQRFEHMFSGRVQRIFASSAMKAVKPDAAYFQHIEKELGLKGEELCLIDDMPGNIEGARRCGWQAHHFTSIDRLKEFLAANDA